MYLELNIDNSNKFCEWLIPKIQNYLYQNIDDRKLEKINLYLNENKLILFNYNEYRIISAKNILLGGIYNLRVRISGNNSFIEIDPSVIIPNTSAKFIDIVKLINFGNLDLQGYRIISDTMEYFAENINLFYNQFLKENN